MTPKSTPQVWVGALRFVPFLVASILIISIITLGLSAAHGVHLAAAPLDSWKHAHPLTYPNAHRWTNA